MDLDHDACYRAICARDPRFDGRFFTGVRTTRIYCRPICPARTPRRENVVFFASAAAAQEADFRPCLRCRPESAPDLGAWRGASNTVSRALALIELGALDEEPVERLAERLGVGGRHLRRLFAQSLGASPVAVAQTRRVLLAKQLIDETTLPMTEVALASGFGSLRRFNETFLALYRKPPVALRRGRSGEKPEAGETALLLRYKPPYDWPALLSHLRPRMIAGVESIENGIYRRSIALQGEQGIVSVELSDGDALRARVRFPKLSALPNIIARLRRVFDLAADPQAVALDLSRDAILAPLIAERPGLRLAGAWDGFEMAARAILGQQVTVAGAARLAARLTERFGDNLRCADPVLTKVFPEPAALAEADLTGLGLTRARAESLKKLAAAVAADPHIFSAARPQEEVQERLRALPGIGDWTAQYLALRLLRAPDAFPAADIGLRRAMSERDGARPSPKELLGRAENWRPWRAYAAQYLWTSGRTTAPPP